MRDGAVCRGTSPAILRGPGWRLTARPDSAPRFGTPPVRHHRHRPIRRRPGGLSCSFVSQGPPSRRVPPVIFQCLPRSDERDGARPRFPARGRNRPTHEKEHQSERKRRTPPGHRGRHHVSADLGAAVFSKVPIGELFGVERLQPRRDEGAAAEAGLQVGRCGRSTRATLDPSVADVVAVGDEGLGDREGRDALRARLLPADRPHRREARQLPLARRRRRRARRVRRQDADPGRARRVELPERRHPRHLRGARLHRLGRHQPGLHPREPQRHDALHPDRVRVVDGRGARQEDAAAALDAGAQQAGAARPEALRPHKTRPRSFSYRRRRAGVLPDRPALLLRAARPARRPAARCSARRRPRARSSRTTTSARSPSACWRSCSSPSASSSSSASR